MNSPSQDEDRPLSFSTTAGLEQVRDWSNETPGNYNFIGTSPRGVFMDVMAHYTEQTSNGRCFAEARARRLAADGSVRIPDTAAEVNCYMIVVADESNEVHYLAKTDDRARAVQLFQVGKKWINHARGAYLAEEERQQIAHRLDIELRVLESE